ncbi:unnamed protein product [Brachionus calyciflorus]|uniref:Aminopeptidase n=1 Tax=Brachionus calyciflorus TaxID=104777 RepID=A0A813TXQ0_9BILA|nr:unnamed protein product [Brachionus calyciflorus]
MMTRLLNSNDQNKIQIGKRILIITILVFIVILVGSILATYFGKSCNTELDEKELTRQCKAYLCKNEDLFDIWHQSCPSTTTTVKPDTTTTPQTSDTFRLPEHIKPIHYDLEIKPYVGPKELYGDKAFSFEGQIEMEFLCAKPTNKVMFHQKELKLTLVKFKSEQDPDLKITNPNFEFDYKKDFVSAYFDRDCKENVNYSLTVKFEGVILDKLYGFYRSSFLDKQQQRHYLAVTKFEPTYARRAFPCFDEPAMKAEYTMRIIRPKTHKSYANNPLERTEPTNDPNWVVDHFNRTVPMSTYLVAYLIAEFDSKFTTTSKGIEVEVSGRPEAIQNGDGDFGLEEAAHILDFYADYFNVPYPLPKSTQTAIPDFNSGAMENWGLVTYRETSLLYNNKTDTIANKRRVSKVVSHELAHQWFGNLCTMLWWNDLWLNEGFASWVEYLGYNYTHPEWRDLDFFFVNQLSTFIQDSLESSHPISVEVNDPNEITSLFDGISYGKGASIIRMMNAFLTEYTFKRGVTNYLNKYQFSNAEQDNLWEELEKQGHADGTLDRSLSAKTIMDTWTLRKGYPVVTVIRDYTNNKMSLKQNWFLLNPNNSVQYTDEYAKYRWYIPFTFTQKENPNFDFETRPIWLKPEDLETKIDVSNSDGWIIGNLKHSGFYRVNYDTENWQRLIKQLEDDHTVIDPINRAQILDDTYNLGRAEVTDQLIFLNISKYLKNESDGLAFTAAFNGLDYINNMIESEYFVSTSYKNFYMSILETNYRRLDWNLDLDDANEINLQISTVYLMCKFGNKDCIAKSWEYYEKWVSSGQAIPANFKGIVYQTIAKFGNDSTWFQMLEIAKKTSDNTEKLRILRALTSTQNYNLLKYILSLSYDESVVRRQDMTALIADVASNFIGRRLAFDFIDQKWDDLLMKFGDISFTLANLVKNVLANMNTEFDMKNLDLFQKQHPNLGIASNAFKESLETVSLNKRWMDKYFESISQWLKNNGF